MAHIDPGALAGDLRRLGENGYQDVAAAVREVIHAATDLFPITGCGLMIADEQHDLHYVAASNRQSEVLERVQSRAGEGPCVSAFVHNRVIRADDLHDDERWPLVRETLLRHDVIAVMGVPVRVGGVPVGTFDLFVDRPHAWDDSEAAALQRYSDLISSTLGAALAAQKAGVLAGQLQYALDYRIVIERAVGFLMARRDLGADQAFTLLRGTARSQRRKVAAVAQHLLETGDLPAPPG